MNKFFSIALMALVFTSCQNSSDKEDAETVTTSPATTTTPASGLAADSNRQSVVTGAPAMNPVNVTTAAPPVSSAIQGGGSSSPNPAHGAPGHRCDIAVGAPLNSPATNKAAPAVSGAQAPTMTQMPATTSPVTTGGKLNPAHGQPGHDCAVPVGQPLKS